MAIQDDKAAWAKSGNKKSGGKPLLVDQADYGTQHIFFDDVANNDTNCQVDVIDTVTGFPIQYAKFINKYVVKVESHRAIMEADYFIKAIEHAEQQRTLEIERIESGMGSEEEEARKSEL